jgi:hypothetical protein
MVDSFPLIGDWTIWRVGNGKNLRLGKDSWEGSGNAFNLSVESMTVLQSKGIYYLWDVRFPG